MNKTDLIAYRTMIPEDKNFIMATFLRGLYYGDSVFTNIPKNIFMTNYHTVAEGILARPSTRISIACLKEDPTVILGYSVLNDNETLSWVFVKKNWRGIGIAKDLTPSTVKTVTHLTKVGLSIVKKKGLVFNPFLT